MVQIKLPRFPPRKARKTPTLIKFVVRWLDRFQILSNTVPSKSPFSFTDRIKLLVLTALNRTSISRKARDLRDNNILVPSGEATLAWLKTRTVKEIVESQQLRFQDFLDSLPDNFQKIRKQGMLLAIDFHTDPNYTKHPSPYICGGKLKASTNQFFQYITVIWINAPKPITLGVQMTRSRQPVSDTVQQLLEPLITQEKIIGILGDGDFYNWDIIQWFIHKQISFIVRGRVNHGVKPLVQKYQKELENKGGWVVLDYRMNKGRTRKYIDVKLTLYQTGSRNLAIIAPSRCNLSGNKIYELYRKRFIIETYYRQMHRFQMFSCSQHPSVRFTIVVLAFWLCNFWSYFKSPISFLKSSSRKCRADFVYTANDFCEFILTSWHSLTFRSSLVILGR
ncbi:MAG: transposase [Promethearchaeota archaeon]